jgi:TonB family protein
MQQHLETERLTPERSNIMGVAFDTATDQNTSPRFEEDEQSDTISTLLEEVCHEGERLPGDNLENSEPRSCDDTEAATGSSTPVPANVLPSAADILDSCFPSFRVNQREVKAARLWRGDLAMTLQLILVIALALLLGWMLGRPSSRKIADKKGARLVSAKQDAVTAQPKENRPSEKRSQPPDSPRPGSREMPRDSLVIYEGGKAIFRQKDREEADSANAKSRESLPHAEDGPLRPTTARLVRRVEPEYPEAARQQRVEGPVVLEALVGEDGTVKQLSVTSGNSLLATAASDAVRRWRFAPLVQNGQAVRFQTQIKINYVLP